MSFDNAFRPAGNTVLVIATSSTGATPTQWNASNGMPSCWCVNGSTVPVYLAWGSSTVAAGIATTGTPIPGLVLPSTMSRVFHLGPNNNVAWLSAVTSGGSANVFVTPGYGF